MTALEFMNDAYSPQYYEYAYNMAAPSGPSRRCVTLVISRGHRDFGELGMRMAGDTMGVEGVNERLMTVDSTTTQGGAVVAAVLHRALRTANSTH